MRSIRARQAMFLAAVAGMLICLVPSASGFTGWTVVPTPNAGQWGSLLSSVSARSPTDVWAVGVAATSSSNQTLAIHWNGANWAVTPTANPVANCQDGNIQWAGNRLNAVSSVSATDVWAVGTSCYQMNTVTEHWNGSAWRLVPSPSIPTGGDGVNNVLNGVAAISPANVFAVGFHTAANGAYQTLVERWNGSSWGIVASPNPNSTVSILTAAAQSGAADVWAVGYQNVGYESQPLIEHWNGTSWAVVSSPTRPGGTILTAVTAISATDAWAVGSQPAPSGATTTLVEHWNGTSWSVVPSPNVDTKYGSANVLRGVSAVSPSDVWAAGMFQNANTGYHQRRTFTLHWNGSGWSQVTSPSPGKSGELNAVSALSTGQVWTAGLYSIYDIDIYQGTYTAPRTLVVRG